MVRRAWTLCVVWGVALCLLAGTVAASPVFSINTLDEWTLAHETGHIIPVPADAFRDLVADEDAWPDAYQDAKFFTPTLYVMEHTDGHGQTEPGLVMHWGDPAQGATNQPPPVLGDRVAAAWDFVYDEDPAFNATNLIEFSIHAPVPGMYVSLNLFDAAGNYREWIWLAGDPANPDDQGKIPFCTWTDVQVNPVTLWSNYEYETVFTHGVDFDLSSIQFIRFNENGIWSEEFWAPNTTLVWNAWDHVEVQPEPTTMLLLGGGLMGLAAKRRRRR